MFDIITEAQAMALVGLLTGALLGISARLGRFCTLGAIEDALYGGSTLRLRQWGVAIGIAVMASFALIGLGLLPAAETLYLSQAWNPLASVAGGLAFGYGMALAGNCGFGAIARLGGGDLRSFVIVLVMGVATYATLAGPGAGIRQWLFPTALAETPPGIAHALGGLTGLPVAGWGLLIGLGLTLLAAGRLLWTRPGVVAWGGAVGLSVAAAWAGTTWIAREGFAALAPASHSFSAPLGETILWMMIASGAPLSFAVGSVAGVWTGAFAGSLIRGHFRWEACEDPRELRRQILGAALMGAGAVVAMGCTIGQGISAFSVLAFSAPVTFAAIFAGAAFGLRQLITGFMPAE